MAPSEEKHCAACSAPETTVPCRRCPIRLMQSQGLDFTVDGHDKTSAIYLDGNIRLMSEIGRGGMGTVFSALDETLERIVAVKFLLPELTADPAAAKRFRSEAKATASIRHNNVIQIYTFGTHGASDYFVAEYIDGDTVEKALDVSRGFGRPMPINCALWIIDHAAAGLTAVQEAGVVHRDIKPANLMIEAESGRIVIMDFGIGHRLSINVRGETAPGGDLAAGAGTPAYMAPEVITENEGTSVGPAADIYAFGVTAFEVLTGQLPFDADNWLSLLRQHLEREPPAPSSIRPDLPHGIDEVVLRCLEKSPQDRYGTFAEVRRALRPVLDLVRAPWRQRRSAPAEPSRRRNGHRTTPPHGPRRRPAAGRVILAARDMSLMGKVQDGIHRALPGFALEAARSPAAALELAEQDPPRVLIGPLHDDDLNGLELAALVSEETVYEHTGLILIGDSFEPGERELLRDLGVAGFMSPDDETGEIEATLRHALKRRRGR